MSRGRTAPEPREGRVTRAVERWFAEHRRDLPWRAAASNGRRDPYHALVAETMAQQTQISRVVERFGEFVARFPRVESLASADEGDVLAAWAGLGYYRRAKNLHAAARVIAGAGTFPGSTDELAALPGVGRYTAGAIASIVFGERCAMVDGNVVRVLARLDMPPSAGEPGDGARAERERWAWRRSGALVAGATDPGAFNEGLMELGATVCLPSPRTPLCGKCPLAHLCRARRAGVQTTVPPARPAPPRATVWADAVVVVDAEDRVLLERRSASGMWAGMWQVPTVESAAGPAAARALASAVGVARPRRVGEFDHTTSHRLVKFSVWLSRPLKGRPPARGLWQDLDAARSRGISSAQRRVLELGADAAGVAAAGGMLTP